MQTEVFIAIVIASLVSLLIQTSRASYWLGMLNGSNDHIRSINEENRETRRQRDRAIEEALEMRKYLQRLHERSLIANSEPELFNELMRANDLLRSLNAIVEREGADTNWESIGDRLSELLEDQRSILYATRENP